MAQKAKASARQHAEEAAAGPAVQQLQAQVRELQQALHAERKYSQELANAQGQANAEHAERGREETDLLMDRLVQVRYCLPSCDWFSRWVYTAFPPAFGSHAGYILPPLPRLVLTLGIYCLPSCDWFVVLIDGRKA
eukprot:1185598-Prorocentrum_minimum.AAC.3